MSKSLRMSGVMLLTLVVALATSCGGALTGGGGGGGGEENKKVAALLYSQGFEFMVALGQGIKDEAERQGVEVVVLDAQQDSANQVSQIEDQIAAGVDGIILSPNNSEELVPGVERINEAGIPVVTVDSIVAGGEVNSVVAYDNVAAGKMGAEHLAKLMNEQGTVLEFEGAQGAFHAIRRGDGFKQGMEPFPNIEVISRDSQWTADRALSITADVLTANDDINGIFSHNDEMVRGIVSGLEQTNKAAKVGEEGHIPLVGVDGTPLALDRIRNGTQDATVDQDAFVMGALSMETMMKILNGEDVPKEQLTEPKMITKDNVDDPELWGNKFKPEG
jgi:ribose transport system substrate-binding protein